MLGDSTLKALVGWSLWIYVPSRKVSSIKIMMMMMMMIIMMMIIIIRIIIIIIMMIIIIIIIMIIIIKMFIYIKEANSVQW